MRPVTHSMGTYLANLVYSLELRKRYPDTVNLARLSQSRLRAYIVGRGSESPEQARRLRPQYLKVPRGESWRRRRANLRRRARPKMGDAESQKTLRVVRTH